MFETDDPWREAEDDRTAVRYGGYGNAMAEEAARYHSQGHACPFDCGECGFDADPFDYFEG